MGQDVEGVGAGRPQLGHPQLRRQAVLAALAAVLQQDIADHAQRGSDVGVVQEGSVANHGHQVAVVLEAALGQHRLEGHAPPLARRHRRVEGEDAVVELVVGGLGPRPLDRQAAHHQVAREADVDLAQGLGGAVLQLVGPAGDHPGKGGADVDVEPHVHDLGLGRGLEFQQGLFVIGQPAVLVLLAAVGVPDIGVDEDEDARTQEDQQGGQRHDPRPALQPPRQAQHPRPEPALDPTPPEAVGQHQQDDGEGAPIEPEPGRPDPEPSLAVHVRQGDHGS